MTEFDLNEYRDHLFVVSFSGGKDSVATWLHLERDLGLRVRCLYADTGWESDELYPYLDLLESAHRCPLVRVKPKIRHIWKGNPPARIARELWDQTLDMRQLVQIKGRPPSPTKRFCTTILKLRPIHEYIQSLAEPIVMASGVRAQESTKRAAMALWGHDDFMDRMRWLPIHGWPVEEVFAIHHLYRVPINPLYLQGCSRVGCFPCVLASKADIAVVAKDKSARERVIELEYVTGQTFFSRKTTAQKFRSKSDPKTGKRINTAEDVFRWALGESPAYAADGLFADQEAPLDYGDDMEAEACSSVYGLCE